MGRVILIGMISMALAGCMDYLDRRESVSFGAGNAQQANLITHVITPLPPHAANRRLLFNGQRIQGGLSRYRTDKVEEAIAPATQ
jgi:hypothetical protein